jgi:hypothetical protein
MECFYKGLDERVAIVSPRYGAALQGNVTFRAHLVQPKTGETLEYAINGSTWKPMKEVARPFYRAVYETTGNSTAARDGLITLKVRSVPGGEIQSRVFVVHNHQTPSPAAADATVSFAVGTVWPSKRPPKGKVDVVLNEKVLGTLEPNRRKAYTFGVDAADLRQVNVLSFRFADPEDGMVITHPFLKTGAETIEDPRGAAIRKVREGHWPEETVRAMGFTVGNGPNEHSFATGQDVFYFVLDPNI